MSKTLPIKHLSARVPWHDNKWNGTFCCNVLDNSFCRILPLIDDLKVPEREDDGAVITESNYPPCLAEKGTFMSPHEFVRPLKHKWSDYNKLYKNFLPSTYHHKPFSFNAVPFLWMLKNKASDENGAHRSQRAEMYELDYKPELEEEVDRLLGFEGNTWVQHPHNQKVLLDAFFGCLKKRESLVFFYAKHTPLSEPNERVIVGVAKVKQDVGHILEYNFPQGYTGHKSYPWDRCIEHTLTDRNPDGFLMPYHDLIEAAKTSELDLHEFAAIAPDFTEFSFASELVEHDTSIDALLNMAECLRKAEAVLEKNFKSELAWIDAEISRIWDMRGAYPGMGPVLSALKIEQGNTIAWEIEKYIREQDGDLYKTNPFDVWEECLANPTSVIGDRGAKLFTKTAQVIWKSLSKKKRAVVELLSRIQINNEQAKLLYNDYPARIGTTEELLANPYLLYERTRYTLRGFISFKQIDKALLPPEKLRDAFPIPEPSAMDSNLDERRVRAMAVWILEEAADEGHSLLPFEEVLLRMEVKELEEPFPVNEDILESSAESEFFCEEATLFGQKQRFLKLQRLSQLREVIRLRISKERILSKQHGAEEDWLAVVNNHKEFRDKPLNPELPNYDAELLARCEKAEALRVLTNYKVSVLIGPAGSGKTTLLKIFEALPLIRQGGVLKLAPTGKARVKLGHDAKTIAQFLYPDRYNGEFGTYTLNDEAAKQSTARNVIIDEASMLTEEQLAAVLDALGPVDRLILVGDYRQLPPIGTGRPFVDIVDLLKPDSFADATIKAGPAYAELCQISRQSASGRDARIDVALSQCFGDTPTKEGLDLFHEIASGQVTNEHISLHKWYDSKDFRTLFEQVLTRELGIEGASDVTKAFNRTLGAVDDDEGRFQYFNINKTEKEIENWQIISPVNGYGFGTKEVNKFVQRTYRKSFVDMALRGGKYKVAKPKGPDNIVYGDKVINLRNTRWESWQYIQQGDGNQTPLRYIANGEIGVITGKFLGKFTKWRGEPPVDVAFSTQPGYAYSFNPKDLKNDCPLELAYAITVHKAQGSGFKKVFFVLPSKGAILSRELLYTALTRQEDKIIILHQGEFRDFLRLASTEASATARRFTDLFFMPSIKQVKQRYYDARYINISERGEPMISKNEVIIANCLNKYKKQISYAYEDKLRLEESGRTVKPDFTIESIATGRLFYWEHLGMMSRKDYREKWARKLQGYLAEGFVLHTDAAAANADKVLIITEERPTGGVNSQYFDQLVKQVILEEVNDAAEV